jgi:hypothetical protein
MRETGKERETGNFVEQKIRYLFPCLLELQDILIIIRESFTNVVAKRQWLLLRHCLSCHVNPLSLEIKSHLLFAGIISSPLFLG